MSEDDATAKLVTSSPDDPAPSTTPHPLVPGVEPGHLTPLAQAAALSFLGLLALGGLFLIALKLHYPNLGAGANIVEALSSIVILGLASLRAPIHLGDLTFTVLPLGALVAVFFVVRWACRVAVPSAPPRRGLVVGAVFGAMALLAALVFRLRFDPDPIYAGALGSAAAGAVWVGSFSALAFAGRREPLRNLARRRLGELRQRRPSVFEGVRAAAVMLAASFLLSTAGALLWAIFSLLSGGGPDDLDAGEFVGAIVYVAAFAPNLVVTVLALSLGAPVDVGAGLTIHGKLRGDLEQWSVVSGGLDASLLLLLVPLIACAAGGYWARRNSTHPERVLRIVAVAAGSFASVVALLGWLGEARLGVELAGSRGFGVIAPRGGIVFLLALVWAAAAGYLGWKIAGRKHPPATARS